MLQQETEAAPPDGDPQVASLLSGSVRVDRYPVCEPATGRIGRFADLLLASVLILLTLPLAALVCLAIKLDSSGPVFSRQLLLRADGRPFQMLKFRTRLPATGSSELSWRGDAPWTRVGRFLSYTRIEDLPQLINVVRGEMSILDRSRRSPGFLE